MKLINKKLALTVIVIVAGLSANAQKDSDLSLLYGSDELLRLNIEYRKPLNDKLKLKIGVNLGNNNNFNFFNNGSRNVTSASDSLIVFKDNYSSNFQSMFRVGVENQLGESIFSMGVSGVIGYKQTKKGSYVSRLVINSEGDWELESQETPLTQFTDPNVNSARITQHFLNTGIRLSLNMDIPIKERAFFHVGLASTIQAPIYMGATNVITGDGEFLGTPPSTFDFRMNGLIGIRYILGSGK